MTASVVLQIMLLGYNRLYYPIMETPEQTLRPRMPNVVYQ